jgi:hypothetical protein
VTVLRGHHARCHRVDGSGLKFGALAAALAAPVAPLHRYAPPTPVGAAALDGEMILPRYCA